MVKRWIVWLGFALLVMSSTALAASKGCPPEFGYIQMPPFGYTDEGGSIQGYLAEIAKAVFDQAGIAPYYNPLPAARLYQNIRKGDTLITMGPKDLVFLRDHALQSARPAITMNISAYHRPETPPVKSLADLKNRHVVIINGYSYGKLVKALEKPEYNIMLERVRTHDSGLKMAQLGRVDYFIDYRIPADTVIAADGIRGLERETLANVGIHFFVSKACPDAARLMSAIDDAYGTLKQNGQIPQFDPDRWKLDLRHP
ncbi:transporter substrate-binding domain-containing protein [Marinobacteraceae bacterium S3BR75-40.1]